MYRDDATAGRARWSAAEQRWRAARDLAAVRRDAAQAAQAEVRAAGGVVLAALPALADAPPRPAPGPAATRAELDDAAEDVDAAAADLEQLARQLEEHAAGLGRRRAGEPWVEPLGPAPRRVPRAYVIAEWLGVFAGSLMMMMIALPIGGLLMSALAQVGGGLSVALVAALLVWGTWATLHTRARVRLLAEGVLVPTRLVGQRSTSTSMKNWPVRRAGGWQQTTVTYSGPGLRSEVAATLPDGREESFVVTGGGWYGAAVLWRPGERLRPVMAFHSAPYPDLRGAWNPRLQGFALARAVRGALVVVAVVVGAIVTWSL